MKSYENDTLNFKRSLRRVEKEDLAAKPLRYLIKHLQIWIDIGFDLEADQFKLKYIGVDVEKIRELELTDFIYKHKEVDCSTRNMIRKVYHTIHKNTRYVTTVTYAFKTKRCEVEHGKMSKTVKKGHNLENPSCYPIALVCSGETNWKISLQSYTKTDSFRLTFNDIEFKNLPYQSEIVPCGPQNINYGKIKMNGVKVLRGFKIYSELKDDCLPESAVVTDLWIGGSNNDKQF